MSLSDQTFSSLSIGEGEIINRFNADGSYTFQGIGTMNTVRANQFNGNEYIINSGNTIQGEQLGIFFGGVGRFAEINIDQVNRNTFPGASGNLIFTNNLKQGIVFADKSFLNSVKKLDDISGDTAYFNSINLTGNITGNNTSVIFSTINCLNSATFNKITSNNINSTNITGNNAYFDSLQIYNDYIVPTLTTNIATIDSINGNNISGIQSIKFIDGTEQTSAPGAISIANISNNWNLTGGNALISDLPAGKWIVSFNINFTSTSPTNNYVNVNVKSNINNESSSRNLYQFGLVSLPNTTNSTCSGTYIYQQSFPTTIDLIPNIIANVDPLTSYHTAIRIG